MENHPFRLGDHGHYLATMALRYSLKTLLTVVALAALPLGSVAIYNSIWNSHCRRLEPSLCALILQEEIDHELYASPDLDASDIVIYFALGRSDSDGDWIVPTDRLIREIEIDSVVSVSEMVDEDFVHCIENLRWLDWNTVIVDHGLDGEPLERKITDTLKVRHRDGKWKVVNYNWED